MNKVYKVIQHQAADPEYDNQTIYIYDNIEAAEECARRLNLEYAEGVVLDDEGLFSYLVDDSDTAHYYTIESDVVESKVDDEVYDPSVEKNNEKSNIFLIALYYQESMEFVGFYANPEPTKDKDKATYYNEATVENIASMIEDEGIYSTEIFHYTKADEA